MFNKRTGHLVSGHQRLALMDAIEGRADYVLDVAVVDLSEKEEEEQIIFFNNQEVMGTYDFSKLRTLLMDVEIANCGFQPLDLKMMLPEYEIPLGSAEQESLETVQKMQTEIAEAKAKKRKGSQEDRHAQFMKNWGAFQDKNIEVNPEREDLEYFTIVVFPDEAMRGEFMALFLATDPYMDGKTVGDVVVKGIDDDKAKKWAEPAKEAESPKGEASTGDGDQTPEIQDGHRTAKPAAGGSVQPA